MSPLLATLVCFGLYIVGYRFYGRRIARRSFELDDSRLTPAHELKDGHDYVPTPKPVLFGHHYASIAGLAPMLGPAIAVIWGWVPAMIWVVVGTLLVGAVHDFSALCISMRAKGKSIGRIAEDIIGRRAKYLFHALIVFLVGLAMGVFVQVVAQLFSSIFYPEAVTPSTAVMVLAIAMGYLSYRKGVPLRYLVPVGATLLFVSIWLGMAVVPTPDLSTTAWSYVLLVYAFCASVLPVWLLLQPRDFLNSILLYIGLIGIFASFVIQNPEFAAPAYNPEPSGAPPILPFVFVVIACGAVSGFHALVSSGTTAKQINKESDAPLIGYGGMIAESLLGLSAVLACTAGFASRDLWHQHYADWNAANGLAQKLDAYITGAANFLVTIGIPVEAGKAFVALVAVSFALTTLDSATRILRYNIEEISESIKVPVLGNRHVASLLAVAIIGFFALMKVPSGTGEMVPAGTALWALFGTTNQIMAGLTLLSVTLYLYFRKKPFAFALFPMVFMVGITIAAMIYNISIYAESGNLVLLLVGGAIMALAVGLVVEGILRFTRGREAAIEGIRRAFGD